MNRQEWKDQYAAARMLIRAKFFGGSTLRFEDEPHREIVWDVVYQHISENMHSSIKVAAFTHDQENIFSLKDYPHMIRYNSSAFNRKMPTRQSKLKWRAAK